MLFISYILKLLLSFCYIMIGVTSFDLFIASFELNKIDLRDKKVSSVRFLCFLISICCLLSTIMLWI
jgi:hypothetical protein